MLIEPVRRDHSLERPFFLDINSGPVAQVSLYYILLMECNLPYEYTSYLFARYLLKNWLVASTGKCTAQLYRYYIPAESHQE